MLIGISVPEIGVLERPFPKLGFFGDEIIRSLAYGMGMGRSEDKEQVDPGRALTAPGESVHLRFDRNTHPDPVARARAWQAATSVSMETEFEPGDLDGFAGSVRVSPIGHCLLADLSLACGTMVRRRSTRIKWEHDHVILNLVVEGRLHGHIGGKAISVAAGDCTMVELRRGMCLRVDQTRFLGLIIPRSLFVRQAGATAAVDGLLFVGSTPEGRVLASMLGLLAAQVDHLAEPIAKALVQAVFDVVVACVSPPGGSLAHGSRSSTSTKTPTLAQLRRFIDRHAADPDFGSATLCARFGLSRTALYRIFAPAGGVAEAIRRRRAAIAVRLLTQPDTGTVRIAEIAQASGFGTQRSLRNALYELYAASPREIIRDGIATAIKPEPLDREIGRLFDEL